MEGKGKALFLKKSLNSFFSSGREGKSCPYSDWMSCSCFSLCFLVAGFCFRNAGPFLCQSRCCSTPHIRKKKRAVLQIFRARDQKRDVYHRGLEGNKKRATAIITPPAKKNTRILCAQKLKRVRGVVAVVAKFLRITLHRVQKLFCLQKKTKKGGNDNEFAKNQTTTVHPT